MCASYDAAEDNEISMREGEQILEIEETDEAWWTGTTANGQRGLFPCTSLTFSVSPSMMTDTASQ
jgi:hypothetical protein